MIHRKRIRTLARTSFALFSAIALAACSTRTPPAPSSQTPDPSTRQSNTADSGSVLPEVVVTAPRASSPRVAKEPASRSPAKLGG
jgi:hypothetical protein